MNRRASQESNRAARASLRPRARKPLTPVGLRACGLASTPGRVARTECAESSADSGRWDGRVGSFSPRRERMCDAESSNAGGSGRAARWTTRAGYRRKRRTSTTRRGSAPRPATGATASRRESRRTWARCPCGPIERIRLYRNSARWEAAAKVNGRPRQAVPLEEPPLAVG